MFETYLKWFQSHERLLLAVLAGLILWLAIGKIDNLIANHDKANLTAQQAVLQSQVEKNNALAVQVQQQAAQYQALAEKVSQQNAALEQANVALAAALTKQQKTDAGLAPTELTTRWNQLVPNAAVSVTNGQIVVPNTGAVATVQQLELVPVQQQELNSAQTEIKGNHDVISAANAEISTLNQRIDGLNNQVVDETKVCSAQIAVVKAEAAKSKRRWFVAGFIAGIATRILGKF
jgi:hypothetical protein